RYRLYSGWGVPPGSIAKVVIFCALTYIVGAVTLFVGAAVLTPPEQLATEHLSTASVITMLVVAVLGLAIWWGVIAYSQWRPVSWRGNRLDLPTLSLSLKQTAIAVLDLVVA